MFASGAVRPGSWSPASSTSLSCVRSIGLGSTNESESSDRPECAKSSGGSRFSSERTTSATRVSESPLPMAGTLAPIFPRGPVKHRGQFMIRNVARSFVLVALACLGAANLADAATDRPLQSFPAAPLATGAAGADLLFVVGGDNRPATQGGPLPRVLGTILSEVGLIRPDFVIW